MSAVTRRRFLSGAVATTGAVVLSQQTANKPISLEQMAQAMHETVGRYSDHNVRFDLERTSISNRINLEFAMECMRDCSVVEIQRLLKPWFGGAL